MNQQLLKIKKQAEQIVEAYTIKSKRLSIIRLTIFSLIFFFLILTFQSSTWILKGLIVFLLCLFSCFVFYHKKINCILNKAKKYIEIIYRYQNRTTDDWKKEEFSTAEDDFHFLEDLNITGKNSLFTYINFTQTLGGKNRLLEELKLKEISKEKICAKQKAVNELIQNIDFILAFQEGLGQVAHIEKKDFKTYLSCFGQSKKRKPLEFVVSILLSMATIITLILGCLSIIHLSYFMGLAILQIIAAYFYQYIYQEEFNSILSIQEYKHLMNSYLLVKKQSFSSDLLLELQAKMTKGEKILNRFNRLAELDTYRLNFVSFWLGNIFFSLNFLILFLYRAQSIENKEELKQSIIALEEIEGLISLTTIGLVKNKHCMPKINSTLILNVKEGKHPLLKEDNCVANTFNTEQGINIITGSNMSGKTSFMKMIGVNLVLTYLGGFVAANEFSAPLGSLFTSINVKDDLSNGISTFYGELLRMKEVLTFSKENPSPMIVFIDEIFKGTNYNDRIFGAREMIKQLVKLNCIVFLTTHDFELCDMNNIVNYHFKETYQDDKILFDYKIQKGRCVSTNAKYLMKKMQIIKE